MLIGVIILGVLNEGCREIVRFSESFFHNNILFVVLDTEHRRLLSVPDDQAYLYSKQVK